MTTRDESRLLRCLTVLGQLASDDGERMPARIAALRPTPLQRGLIADAAAALTNAIKDSQRNRAKQKEHTL
jgi:hypothetical protein